MGEGLPGASEVAGALDGIRVLDFTRFMQGPIATRLLANMGATVVKVERPGGEWDRRLRLAPDGFGGFFHSLNRGKRSVAIDLATDEGKQIVLKLAAECDVVVENFRPGVMERLGLGYEDLRAVNPRIIYAAGSGYGPNGPRAAEPMYDMVAQAVSGLSDFVSGEDGKPRLSSRGLADSAGGVFLAMAVVSALYVRERTGIGQRVDASLVGAAIALHPAEVTISLHENDIKRTHGRVTSTSGAFVCGDGRWLVIGATDQKVWHGLTIALGREDLFDDERFSKSRIREQNRAEIEPIIEATFLTRGRDEWITRLQDNDVPVAPVNTWIEAAEDPDVVANGYIVDQVDRTWGAIKMVGHPFHMSASPAVVPDWTPELGEDTVTELLAVGLSKAAIDELVSSGVVETFEERSP